MAAIFKSLTAAKVALTIAAWAKNAALLANPITWVVLAVVALIAAIAALVVAVVKNWDKIMDVLLSVAGWINDNVIQPVVGFFTGLWETISGVVTGIWDTITSIFGAIADWVMTTVIDPVIGFFSSMGESISEVFTGVREAICTAMSAVVGVVKKPINVIIGLINTFIGGLNRIQIPNWVPGVGGKGINLPKIPTLNTGGYIKNEGMAYLHPAEVVLNSKLTKGLADILANSDIKGSMIVKANDDKPAPALGLLGGQAKPEPVAFNPAPVQTAVVKTDPVSVPVHEGKDPAASQTTTKNEGNVLFEAGSIVVNVANATLEEAKKLADFIYKEIKRKKELEDMKNYRKIDRRLQLA